MKVGRNDPCPCGSGKKFKKCHYLMKQGIPKEVMLELDRKRALQLQALKQQGLGKPILSTVFNDTRFVSVGSKLFRSKEWKTYHDFLQHYIKIVLGEDWGKAEIKKAPDEGHPIIQWYQRTVKYMKSSQEAGKEVCSAPMIGATSAYLNLAYNLFLLDHNVDLQERLIKRLKDPRQFAGEIGRAHV